MSKSQGYKQLGNGFQVDTIFELLKQLPKDTPLDNVVSAFDGISCLKALDLGSVQGLMQMAFNEL